MAFYNHGDVLCEVSEEQLLASWKEFFAIGTNWKDLEAGITYEKYQAISDKEHVKKILQMPVHFLQESGKGFFVKRDGSSLALREDLRDVIGLSAFAEQMKDVIDYRAMDYYQRRCRMLLFDNAEFDIFFHPLCCKIREYKRRNCDAFNTTQKKNVSLLPCGYCQGAV